MRYTQKKQAESIVRLLTQIHKRVKQQMGECTTENVLTLLGQCQQQAIELGHIAESEEGSCAVLISILEAYCEFLYQTYRKIGSAQERLDPNDLYRELQEWLIQIRNHVRDDIKVHREVVFLPYKASMWDSLESIWKAADADPDSDVYVIPIPYYDRHPDGNIGEIHYEGSLYPDYVFVTDYRDYDFQGRHPDLIFIHNPYDENNYVTSVHPFFYAKNLKKFTEKLVYVPYFVLDEIDPEDQNAVEWIEGFCTVPGVIYADKVIVQSEAMRQIYIKIMTEFACGYGIGKDYWEKKILGYGSPKIDKVCIAKKEELKIPEEWKEIIQKPDGNLKKIVLYNVGINGLLYHNEKVLEKLKSVFHLFKRMQKEIALLWRPHPLLEATIGSMRPELLEAYKKMVEQYRREGWGIYDDTPDIDRAIVLCDAYYGDGSSVIQLCRKIEKIVLLQNVEYVESDRDELFHKALIFENIYDDGQALWFAEYDYNALFCMNKDDHEAELVGVFPNECLMQGRLYVSVTMCDGRLYFAPYIADEIAEYDPGRKTFRKIPIKKPAVETRQMWEHEKFLHMVSIEEKVYFLPYLYPGILCYESETDSMTCFDDWVEQIEEIRCSAWGYFPDYELLGDELILPCSCADAVIVLNVRTGESQVIRTPSTEHPCKYCGICHTEDALYLISADGTVLKKELNSEKEEIKKMHLPVSGFNEIAYYPVRLVNGFIYCFPCQENTGVRIDTRTDEILSMEMFDDECEYGDEGFSFLTSVCDGEILYVVTRNSRRLLEYDLYSEKRKERKLFLTEGDKERLEEYKKKDFYRRVCEETVVESTSDSLEFMLDVLETHSDCKSREKDDERPSAVGNRIYHAMIQKQTLQERK